jgi:DNA ligase-1
MRKLNEAQNRRRLFLLRTFFSTNILSSAVFTKSPESNTSDASSFIVDSINSAKLDLVLPQTLANLSELKAQVTDYLMSEKLDGVRAYWSGKQLYFRSGRPIKAPTWFTAKFPDHPMDGELWMGRAQFERLSGAVRRQHADDAEWRHIQYCLFEFPQADGSFQQRIQVLKNIVEKLSIPWLQVIPQQAVQSVAQVEQKLRQLSLQKAEGLVLHLSSAVFEFGRSEYVYKLKPQHDAEAKVIGIQAGKGKYHGLMGALLLETSDGKRFKLGTGFDDEQRKHPPAIGSWVTYRYRDITSNGLPKFASFVREYRSE